MAKAADISSKSLISLSPNTWVKWATQIPDIVAGEILNSEFQSPFLLLLYWKAS